MSSKTRTIRVGDRGIGPGLPVYVIAEAGVNHNGELSLAETMVKVAADSGADAVKFQAFTSDALASRGAPLAEYQKKSVRGARSQRKMLEKLELKKSDFEALMAACDKAEIEFLASPFDLESLEMLLDLGVSAVKVASPELTDTPLLERIAKKKASALVSTGAATMAEIRTAMSVLRSGRLRNIALFHCVSSYPAPYEQSNLRVIKTLENAFGVPVGYSDHSPGIHIGVAAVAAGALLLEKHFTLDRKLPGPDQALSLEPSELHSFVSAVRQVELALGSADKSPQEAEVNVRESARKSIVTTRAVKKGEKFKPDMLTTKRPASGIEPAAMKKVCRRRAKCNIPADTVLTWDMV